MERALNVIVEFDFERDGWSREDKARELRELTKTAHAEVIDEVFCRRDKPTPNLFIGKGKAEELANFCTDSNIDTVIFSHDLSGSQQRELEGIIRRKTLDRTQLILDIFARHAKSPEGKMQVELAQLQYLLPRLVGKGIILSRLGGGIGTRGPGEQKLEVDRRKIRKRINKLKDDLKRLTVHRETIRKKRKDKLIPSAALVGYTNAGKSTLLNSLANSGQVVRNSLFTTLDPLSRSVKLPNNQKVVLSDTVGFLYKLPHHLVEAFRATLEEVVNADLLINVLDISHPRLYEHNAAVLSVLKELNCGNKTTITVLNKIDKLNDRSWLQRLKHDFNNSVAISAKFKENLNELEELIAQKLAKSVITVKMQIPINRMDLLNFLHKQGKVAEINYCQDCIKLEMILSMPILNKLKGSPDVKIITEAL